MPAPPQFYYHDSSAAIAEAYNQRSQGQRVAVGRDISGKWYVRILGLVVQQEARA